MQATPKSAISGVPSPLIRMFAGLMSRWMQPCLWAY
ncbi:hypothetical protein RB5877 [Rhodopirellula baltica SH 1]|uniref:Uncharacterized protein n=1 Tax=Rhodopirellula baltica (strain DSM 10527 / NCIMB 13988 / SH1) TaxID=243090 RepID=Q7UR55_RHOBA|nr:hypothetical protein RB5877 [Rhodopirellula baltica SH 1]